MKNCSLGVQFHRQVPLLDFIVDFYAPEIQLAIEIHGHAHEYKYKGDAQQGLLESHGVTFLYFSDVDILQHPIHVMVRLSATVKALSEQKGVIFIEKELRDPKGITAVKLHQEHSTPSELSSTPSTAPSTFGFPKIEKLKSKKIIELLFSEGKSLSSYPLKLIYIKTSLVEEVPIQAGVTVSKKKFKHAVSRNRIKRLLRESYRLNKHIVFNNIEGNFAFLFLYIGSEIPSQKLVEDHMSTLLRLFIKRIN